MRRRDFIRLLGGAAACPIAARAQQPTMPLIGFLGPSLDTRRHWLAEFGKGLGTEGFVEGQNVTIEYRSANGGPVGLPELAADLVRRRLPAGYIGRAPEVPTIYSPQMRTLLGTSFCRLCDALSQLFAERSVPCEHLTAESR